MDNFGVNILDAEKAGQEQRAFRVPEFRKEVHGKDGKIIDNVPDDENFNAGIDKSENSGIIKSSDEISATGINKFEKGFSEENLNRHWGGTSDHSSQYPEYTKEQYAKRALELIQSEADGQIILGYKNEVGQIARYDVKNNDFVKGRPTQGIATMFKPADGKEYFIRRMNKEKGINKD